LLNPDLAAWSRFDARPRPAWWRANLRELMERMGHNTARAAMVNLHSTDERQRKHSRAREDGG